MSLILVFLFEEWKLTAFRLSTVSVFSILKSPMILLALVSMGIFLGMPYLIENSTSDKPLPPES